MRRVRVAVVIGAVAALAAGRIAAQQPLDRTAQLLVDIVKVNNSNPPGHENELHRVLEPQFRSLGFQVDVIPTPEAGKSHFIARLKGDGSKKPILLAAHADTVGVEREKWTVDPFGGIVKDGFVYGRGAIDFKGGIAVFARAVQMLAENKVPLARDVIFLSEADEEGAQYNTLWLAKDHWDKIDCEFALNEGGWIMKGDDGKVAYVSISTADKGGANIIVTARGTSTHSSMPRPDNAIFALGRALAKISQFDPKIELTAAQKQFFTTLAKTSKPPMSEYYRAIVDQKDPAAVARADKEISKDPLMHSLMRDTLAPVLMNAGFRGNVIPGSAEATINVRTIPGTDLNALVAELQKVVSDPAVEVKLQAQGSFPPMEPSSENTELYRAFAKQAKAEWPTAEVTPYLFQAGTDAAAWRMKNIPVYGTYPYPITKEELTRMHGNDERVSVESLKQGTDMLYKVLVEVAGKGGASTSSAR